jgi:hypothetical protein
MELTGALAAAGHLLNDKEKPIHQNTKKNNSRRKQAAPNGANIYMSNSTKKISNLAGKLAEDRYKKSKSPNQTGIIPQMYNRRKKNNKIEMNEHFSDMSDSEFTEMSDDMSKQEQGSVGGPNCLVSDCSKIVDNRKHEREFVKNTSNDKNNFLQQFDGLKFDNHGTPVSQNSVPNKFGQGASTSRLEMERELSLKGGFSNFDADNDLTYNVVEKDKFVHNNMTPFFSGRAGYGMNELHENKLRQVNQRKMEQFTGSIDNIEYRPKTERKPLFSPTVGMTNIYGGQASTDFYESRYVPSKEKKNELPFQQIRVTPGLNLGYNQVGSQGYHDSYRPPEKTVDELRPANKPKISYKGRIVEGMKGTKGPISSKMSKRRPTTFKENSTKDMIKGVGAIRAPAITGEIDKNRLGTENRGTVETPYFAAPKYEHELAKPEHLMEKYKETSRRSFKEADPRNVTKVSGQQARPHDESFNPKETQRAQENNHIGVVGTKGQGGHYAFDTVNNVPEATMRDMHGEAQRAGQIGNGQFNKATAFDMINNIAEPTMRDMHSKTERAGQIGAGQFNKGTAFDMINNIAEPTMRDMHLKAERAGQIGTGHFNKGTAFDMINNIADQTMRDIYGKTERAGQLGNGQFNKAPAFDMINNISDPTFRDIHSKTERAGQLGNGQFNKAPAFDMINNIADPTLRDIHSKTERAGNVGTGQYGKHTAFDMINNIADPTMRDIHSKTERAGNVGTGQYGKHTAFDMINNIADPTMRDIHSKTERAGQIGTGQYSKHTAFDMINNIADPTMRDIHSKTERAGQIGTGQYNKHTAFDMINNIADPTMRDIHLKTDRAGQIGTGQYSKHTAFDMVNNIADPTMRDIHSKTDRAGQVGTGQYSKHVAFDMINNIADPTMRDIHGKADRSGNVGNGQFSKHVAFDMINNIADPTMRDIHSKTERLGHIGNGQHSKHVAFDMINNIADPTMRDIHNKNRPGVAGSNGKEKHVAFDYINSVPDNTMRDIHNKNRPGVAGSNGKEKHVAFDYINSVPDNTMRDIHNKNRPGIAGSNGKEKQYAFDYINNVPDNTMRDMHNKNRPGIAGSNGKESQTSRADANHMITNIAKEKISKGRAPTNSNYSKGPTMDYTIMNLKDQKQMNRELYPDSKDTTSGKMSMLHTRIPNSVLEENQRLESYIKETLKGNPLINNLIYKSSE